MYVALRSSQQTSNLQQVMSVFAQIVVVRCGLALNAKMSSQHQMKHTIRRMVTYVQTAVTVIITVTVTVAAISLHFKTETITTTKNTAVR